MRVEGVSGETLWFNHATRKHGSYWKCHPTFENLDLPLSKMPTHSYYGDGSEIPDDVIQHIRDVSWQCAVGFQMEKGELSTNSSFASHQLQSKSIPLPLTRIVLLTFCFCSVMQGT